MRTKILLAIVILFCIAATSNAQINKGRILVGGSISYSASKNQPVAGSKFEIFNSNIVIGKVVNNNNVVGVIFSYGYTRGTFYNIVDSYNAGIFYRKYISLLKNLYFFGEMDATYNFSKTTSGIFSNGMDGTRYRSNGVSFAFIPGISYSLCKRMQVELLMPNIVSLSYSGTKTDYTSSTSPSGSTVKGNNFSVSTNLNSNLLSNFGIGFKFILGK